MAKNNKNKRITKREFNQIKTMLGLDGIKTGMVKQWTGRSHSTIWHIKNSDSFEDYQEKIRQAVASRPSNKKETKEATVVTWTTPEQNILDKLDEIQAQLNTVLKNQLKELELAEQMTGFDILDLLDTESEE